MESPRLDRYKLPPGTRLLPERPRPNRLHNSLTVTLGIIILILAYALVEINDFWQDAEREADAQERRADKYSYLLARVMNGLPLYDKANDVAYIFSKPYAWKEPAWQQSAGAKP